MNEKVTQNSFLSFANKRSSLRKNILMVFLPLVLISSLIYYSYNQSAEFRDPSVSVSNSGDNENVISPTGENKKNVKNIDKVINSSSFNNAEYIENLL